jgi:nicotinate-nucleotide adenylyltransferase
VANIGENIAERPATADAGVPNRPRSLNANSKASCNHRLPPHAQGMKIGLFGGSFNPPHAAHRAASLFAMKRLGLDRVWWLVSPGNPLKDTTDLPPLAGRIEAARQLANHPRIDVTGVEEQLGSRYTVDTIEALRRRCPGVRFVWIMGADNLPAFHRWRGWRRIADLVPLAVIDRGGTELGASGARGARALARFQIPEAEARRLPTRKPPAWVFLRGLKLSQSSTALRTRQAGTGGG